MRKIKCKFFHFLIIACFIAIKTYASFDPDKIITLNSTTGYKKNISSSVFLFNDSLDKLVLADVMSGKGDNLFHANIFNQKILKAHYPYLNLWARFIVANSDTVAHQFYLHFSRADSIYIYWVEHGKLQSRLDGSLVEAIKRQNFGSKFTLGGGDTMQLFLNIKKDDYFILKSDFPVFISEHDSLLKQLAVWRLYWGIFYGIMIALIFNSLAIYIAIRKDVYLYYLALLISVTLFYIDWNKLGTMYIWNKAPYHVLDKFGNNLVFSTLIIMAAFLFCRKFLNLKDYYPKIDKLLILLAFAKGLDYLHIVDGFYMLRRAILNYTVMLTIFLIVGIAVTMAKKNNYNAKMFLWIFLIPSFSVVLNQLNFIGLIPDNIIISNAMQTGMGLAAIGFSVAISASIRKMNNENQRAALVAVENAREKAELSQQVSVTEMKALRSQMNPHFIFNSLQSIQTFLMKHQPDEANDFLLKFSRLMRLVLENSQYSEVPLKDDMRALELYMQLESIRLVHPFTYKFRIDDTVDVEEITIPPLILQPFVENSIWHGLQHKPEPGHIDIYIVKKGDTLYATVEDNGMGRKVSKKGGQSLLHKNESLGMKLTEERLKILNELKNIEAYFTITDLFTKDNIPAGTKVELFLPLVE